MKVRARERCYHGGRGFAITQVINYISDYYGLRVTICILSKFMHSLPFPLVQLFK